MPDQCPSPERSRPDQTGLTAYEAEARLAVFGPNRIDVAKRRTIIRIVYDTLKEPMFVFMLAAALFYLATGDLAEGAFLVVAAAASVGLVVFQDVRSERALNALRDLVSNPVNVIRDGVAQTLPADHLVPGDLIVPSAGERFPADARLISKGMLIVDESALTGEAVPVSKQSGGEAILYAGTLIVSGEGLAVATETGANTRIGGIGASLTGVSERTPLQETTGRLVV